MGVSYTFDEKLKKLVDDWCDRKEYTLLRIILPAYPRVSGLTDEWGELAAALKMIRERCQKKLSPEEQEIVKELHLTAEWVLRQPRK